MKTKFTEVLGNSPRIRLYGFLIENIRTSWKQSELREGANIHFTTLKRELTILQELNIIEQTDNHEYKLNRKNVFVKALIGLYNTILFLEVESK